MHSRAQTPLPAGAHWVGIRLVAFFIPAVALSTPSTTPKAVAYLTSRPYLLVAGAMPLRFEESLPPSPPDLTVRPAAGAPPKPADEQSPAKVPEHEPVAVVESKTQPKSPSTPQAVPDPVGPLTPEPSKEKTSPPILPDDTKQKIRAEDFLPFFQFPGSPSNLNDALVAPPTPGRQPPSSATYRQQ